MLDNQSQGALTLQGQPITRCINTAGLDVQFQFFLLVSSFLDRLFPSSFKSDPDQIPKVRKILVLFQAREERGEPLLHVKVPLDKSFGMTGNIKSVRLDDSRIGRYPINRIYFHT